MTAPADPVDSLLSRCVDRVSPSELRERLATGRPLRVKLGVDPTRPDLTFGHLVVFNLLRQFQELGHTAVLIIGDFTTLIGDPSGRSSTRPVLTREEIQQNAETYLAQAFRVLDRDRTEVRHNSEWFSKMSFEDCLGLARKMTVARMLERDDFSQRHAAGTPISIIEFLYPLVQGYDSIMVQADIELGGTDQLFNLLVGRALQRDAGQPEQIVLTMPLLVGLDGVKKMSKSLGNYIAFNDSPTDMFGKIMSISDEAMWEYWRLLVLASPSEITELRTRHPAEVKKDLGERLVSRLHGAAAGPAERARWDQIVSQRDAGDLAPTVSWAIATGGANGDSARLIDVIAHVAGGELSRKEIHRRLTGGAIKVNGEAIKDAQAILTRPTTPVMLRYGAKSSNTVRLLPE